MNKKSWFASGKKYKHKQRGEGVKMKDVQMMGQKPLLAFFFSLSRAERQKNSNELLYDPPANHKIADKLQCFASERKDNTALSIFMVLFGEHQQRVNLLFLFSLP
jgi:hypothetical protein